MGFLSLNSFRLLFFTLLSHEIVSAARRSNDSGDHGSSGSSTLPNHAADYIHTVRRSQDEILRQIDRLTKTVEEKDHEDYKFRLKFSRKVHTLENKVLNLEQTFTQKVEEVVQRKVDDLLERLRQQAVSTSALPTSSHDTGGIGGGVHTVSVVGAVDLSSQRQNHQPQPLISGNHHQLYRSYQPPQSPSYHTRSSSLSSSYVNNWGFYEHPISQKRVRDTNFGYEPPVRDLPYISLVESSAATPSSRTSDGRGLAAINNDSDGMARDSNLAKLVEETLKKFETYEATLQALRENVTNLEKVVTKSMQQPQYTTRERDNNEIKKMLAHNLQEMNAFEEKHQEFVQRMENLSVELEKAGAKREHAVNESLKEMSSEMSRQISAVKSYTKRQIENVTAQVPDKLRCAQTILEEMLTQTNQQQQKSQYSLLTTPELIADQAENDNDEYDNEIIFPRGLQQSASDLSKELQSQRHEISSLKSEIAKLNISQILLMRTLDEETLKRTVRPRDCSEIRLLRNLTSGVHTIFPRKDDTSLEVYCDMQTDGGGWTVIQRRGSPNSQAPRESFVRSWEDYETGFGSLENDFWLGLSNIATLCHLGVQELRVDLTNWLGETRYANYRYFKVSNASEIYKLRVSGYSGTAGDSLARHSGMAFSTPDSDHDIDRRRHCAKMYQAGWWYYACFESNLNGLYLDETEGHATHDYGTGILWQHWMGDTYSLKSVEMKVRNTFIGENQYTSSSSPHE